MKEQTFFFYDLETSGLNARDDRIMQFAGQRTDMDLNPIGPEINVLVKLADDTLPSPGAIAVTKITPQSTQMDGLTEAEFCKYIEEEIFTENTCAVGYNSVRFDDEFMRHLFWRNFRDPYEWQWKDGRSRWDFLDVVRLTRALRPEGIEWPFAEKDGKKIPTNRLELITKLNGIEHEHAHDALADVVALIEVAKLIKTKQPQLYNYLFKMRSKREVQKLINLEEPKLFVYASGRYANEFNKTTVAFPIAPGRNGNVLVYDLRYDPEDYLKQRESKQEEKDAPKLVSFSTVKELCYNKCPAVAPISVLDKDDGWKKIGLSREVVDNHLDTLIKHPEIANIAREELDNRPEFPPSIDPESALYDGFLNDIDRTHCSAVRNADKNKLADFHPNFGDPRLEPLLLHYKAKNYPESLSEQETKEWEKYRIERLNRQAPKFLKEIETMQKNNSVDPFIIEELMLWYQSLQGTDY